MIKGALNPGNKRSLIRSIVVLVSIAMIALSGTSLAWFTQSGPAPAITTLEAVYEQAEGRLVIRGRNFNSQASVSLTTARGPVTNAKIKIKKSKKIFISRVSPFDIGDWVDVVVTNPDGGTSGLVHLPVSITADETKLTKSDVETIIAQAVAQAEASGLRATIAVTDKEGNVLGVFKMAGAPRTIRIGIGTECADDNDLFAGLTCGLEGLELGPDTVPGLPQLDGAVLGAISKAGTGGVLSTAGGAFGTRIANFLLQEHIPPGIRGAPSGPLFGVQFSQLACSDVNASLPLGLAADPGGLALYKNGQPVGGVGVEGDGLYGLANRREERQDKPVEELVALAGTRGFEPSPEIVNSLFPGGLRLPYTNQQVPPALPVRAFNNLNGAVVPPFFTRDTPLSKFKIMTIGDGIEVRMKIDIPIIGSPTAGGLTASEVERVLVQGIKQALITRAVIHQPVGSHIEVSVGVVDQDGRVLGAASTLDAPISSYDIAVQKARSAAFFTNPQAGNILRSANGGAFLPNRPYRKYAEAATREGIPLNGSIAISGRTLIFLSRPFLPDGIDETENGPFSNPIEQNSAFNTGLQLDITISRILESAISFQLTGMVEKGGCNADIPNLANGPQVRQASVPLFKNGRLVGGVGCSGDGGEQEDIVVGFASAGFEAPEPIQADRFFVRGNIRLPWLKFPRHPNVEN